MDRPRWEYKTVRPPRGETKKEATDPVETLNSHGEDGWKLVETIDYTGGGTKLLVFARPGETESGASTADGAVNDPTGDSS